MRLAQSWRFNLKRLSAQSAGHYAYSLALGGMLERMLCEQRAHCDAEPFQNPFVREFAVEREKLGFGSSACK
jgi:hypothetical protein